jgi:iron complex transport system ATP-binding protein
VAGTVPYGGGIRKVHHILSLKVDESLECRRPERFARARAREMGLHQPFVSLLTGVSLDRAKVAVRQASGMEAAAIVSAGGRNLCAAGLSSAWNGAQCGTINTIAIVDACVSDAALLNLLTVATEAKGLALRERGVLTVEGFPATGTSTDAVVVACTGNGRRHQYGGPVTLPGHLVGAAVLAATRAALDECSIGRGEE